MTSLDQTDKDEIMGRIRILELAVLKNQEQDESNAPDCNYQDFAISLTYFVAGFSTGLFICSLMLF